MNIVILISAPDSRGLVHKISSNLLDFNIEKNDEFVDKESGQFFMRTEISVESNAESASFGGFESLREGRTLLFAFTKSSKNFLDSTPCAESALDSTIPQNLADSTLESAPDSTSAIKNEIYNRLCAILPPQSFIKITQKRKKSIVIFCTKEAHCLGDLLLKNYNNELNIDIRAVVSNHATLGDLVEKFHIPYFHISHSDENYENKMLAICDEFAPDFIVLAKYMRILSPHFIAHYENRIINIHHSFLPAFIGANPYKQAYTRGVKIIGATAHFVTSELDSGPIICQDIMQVNHTLSWRDMQKAGKNIERVVLARAVELAVEERIFIHKNRTIVF